MTGRLLTALAERLRRVLAEGRDDRGEAVVGSLVAIAVTATVALVYVGIPFIGAAYQDLRDWRDGKWSAPPERVGSSPVTYPFVGPALPSDATQAACVKKAAGAAGLVFGERGWEAPGVYPRPEVGASQAVITTWAAQVQSYYQSRQDEWASCLKAPTDSSDTTTTTTEAPLEIAGTYTVSYPPSADGTCSYAPPATLTVSGTADALTITASSSAATDSLTGAVDRTGGFSANGVRDVGGGLGVRMLGRFEAGDSGTVIRNGSLELNGPTSCTFEFTATKQR